jgi:hypothetical protein
VARNGNFGMVDPEITEVARAWIEGGHDDEGTLMVQVITDVLQQCLASKPCENPAINERIQALFPG